MAKWCFGFETTSLAGTARPPTCALQGKVCASFDFAQGGKKFVVDRSLKVLLRALNGFDPGAQFAQLRGDAVSHARAP